MCEGGEHPTRGKKNHWEKGRIKRKRSRKGSKGKGIDGGRTRTRAAQSLKKGKKIQETKEKREKSPKGKRRRTSWTEIKSFKGETLEREVQKTRTDTKKLKRNSKTFRRKNLTNLERNTNLLRKGGTGEKKRVTKKSRVKGSQSFTPKRGGGRKKKGKISKVKSQRGGNL